MHAIPESDEALVQRLLPSHNPDRDDRARAWSECQSGLGDTAVMRFIRTINNTTENDEDILQDALLTAFQEVERGRYCQQAGVPFTAYVKGIARNKVREARRRQRGWVELEEAHPAPESIEPRHLEAFVERQEQAHLLQRSMEALPIDRRRVIERLLSGHSTAEVAGSLAISQDLVRQHKCRGLQLLRHLSSGI